MLDRNRFQVDTENFGPYVVAETDIPAAVAAWNGLIIVDFDETLYLRNSTEDFINSARPSYAAAVALRLLDLVAPWRWAGKQGSRDHWRLRLVTKLLPGIAGRWQRDCAARADNFTNTPLLLALRDKNFIIASNGFVPVIAPLLHAMGSEDIRLIANTPHQTMPKRALIEAAIGAEALAGAMVITDSAADASVLAACAHPCLTRWDAAKFVPAFAQIYLPGDYLARYKRPTERGVLRRLLMEDLVPWLLITTPAPFPGPVFIGGICLLFGSFWAIYEAGYRENDVCAEKFEADPVLSQAFANFAMKHFETKCWLSAALLGLAGVAALRPHAMLPAAVAWGALLLGLRAIYYIYNRLDKQTRVWLYLPLQLFRGLAPAAVLAVGPVGLAAGAAQAAARWQGYFLYRASRAHGVFKWPETPARLTQLVLLLLFLAVGGPDLWTWRAALLAGWCVLLARKEIAAVLRGAHRLDRRGKTSP